MSGGNLFLLVVVQLALTATPGVAATLLALRLGARDVPVLLCTGLAGSGVAAMLTFWVYYGVPGAGSFCAYTVFFGSIAAIVWAWPRVSQHRVLLRQLSVPLGLWALATLFIVFFGFLHGGAEAAIETASYRFSTQPGQMASDSSIPLFFSDWMFAGHPGPPPLFPPDWLFGDRPPLQVAYVLTQRVFGWDTTTLHYELLGVILQQFWIVGMWALLTAARASVRTRALAMVGALVSDVAIHNGFYVWPKLLGAAFVLAALALLVAPREATIRSRPWTVVLLGVLAGLAFLSHGTSVFGLVPVVAVALWRGLPNWRWLAAAAVATLVLVLPWMAYQHFEDPPANRLMKWSLAGVVEIDERGAGETILDEYAKAGLGGTIENKLQNFLTMAGGNPATGVPAEGQMPFGDVLTESGDALSAVGEGRFGAAISKIREIRHWHLFWTVGLLLLALPLIVVGRVRGRGRDDEDWRLARFCGLVFAIGTVGWGLLMFGNVAGRAVATSGSLALPLLAIVALVAGLCATYPRWVAWLVGANAVTVLILFLPTLAGTSGNSYSAFALIAAALSLAGFIVLAFSTRPEQPQTRPRRPVQAGVAGATATPLDD